ncbi:DHS-like NAD/FAD-binding protein [Glarea lozoyensis ATCC 20868]|uniref:DHS-like NAD/FAD-binding protein n=1 Tax=Glarea lozoyensis (strain ATCC 20868 / MF5171) TaxID=1116229 RepID=S3DPF6_GLAL2|nr:DHS-like NAD/FAD-binding protein [Glarea lozoyensis ATCC 20868]EPE28313.1 DHS-like NAD/FAD-binding protein [Glarea lozoyensis ATCC 20868]
MPTISVKPESGQHLQEIADALGKSKRVVVITGAGISTNCGIPDFRSEDGLYSLIQAQYDKSLENPPWEQANTFDIDDRPKKRKRPSYFYEVVAPDGNVVGVIDDEDTPKSPKQSTPETKSSVLLASSSPLSTRSTTPSVDLSDLDNSTQRTFQSHSSAGSITSESEPSEEQSQNAGDEVKVEASDPNPEASCNNPNITNRECASGSRRSSRRVMHSKNPTKADSAPSEPFSRQISRSSTPNSRGTSREPPTSNCRRKPLPGTRRHTLQAEESSFMSSTSTSDDELPATQSSQSSRTSLPNMKGRDLFDSMIWSDPFTTSIFYMFISSLRQKIQNEVKSTTETHDFIRVLRDGGRLVRNYTQNIDCLEERLGLCTELTRGPGNRTRFHSKYQKEPRPCNIDEQSPHNGGVEVVLLHGSLADLRCGICGKLSSWKEDDREAATLSGQAPDCPSCTEYNAKRTGRGRRGLAVGRLRPDIVLYGEEHPHANLVGPLITHDLSLGPDVLLIMGTSLRVHGLKVMLKEFAKAVHLRGGQVVFVNRTKPSESTWGDVIDYWVEWDCDSWVVDLKQRRQDIWLPQGTVQDIKPKREPVAPMRKKEPVEAAPKGTSDENLTANGKKRRWQCLRDDDANGAIVTLKILDTLRLFLDSGGAIARRGPYFKKPDKPASRCSLPIPKPTKREPAPKRRTKSLARLNTTPLPSGGIRKRPSLPRKQHLVPAGMGRESNEHSKFRFLQNRPRQSGPGPLSAISPFKAPDPRSFLSKTHFFSNSNSNHMPNIMSTAEMNLLSLPPRGVDPPAHTPKDVPRLEATIATASHAHEIPSIQPCSPSEPHATQTPQSSAIPPFSSSSYNEVTVAKTRTYRTRSSSRYSASTLHEVQSATALPNVARRCSAAHNQLVDSIDTLKRTLRSSSNGNDQQTRSNSCGNNLTSIPLPIQNIRANSSLPSPPPSGPASDPLTPESRQGMIKRKSSIENILSSPVDENFHSPVDKNEVWHDARDAIGS